MSAETSEILVLPIGDRGEQLRLKLAKYHALWLETIAGSIYTAPELLRSETGTWYSRAILGCLVKLGHVDRQHILKTLTDANYGEIDLIVFNAVFETIRQYVETGKAWGKPLPELPKKS